MAAPVVLDDDTTKATAFLTESPAELHCGSLCPNLLFEIFLLLPFKSLCRLRLVCRAWSRIIGSPIFHLNYMHKMTKSKYSSAAAGGRNHEKGIIICTTDYYAKPRISQLDYFCVVDGADRVLPVLKKRWNQARDEADHWSIPWYTNLSNSCHGMLCAFARDRRIQVWNPLTQEQVHLPVVAGRADHVGLGFCSSTVEHKMVRLQLSAEGGGYSCDVPALGSRSCRRLPHGSVPLCSISHDRPVYAAADGRLYWNLNLGGRKRWRRPEIAALSFDLDREEFELVLHPEHGEYYSASTMGSDRIVRYLAESGDRLCFAECRREAMQMLLWVRDQDHRKPPAWTKMLNIDMGYFTYSWSTWAGHVSLLAIVEDGNFFVFSFKKFCVFGYDPHKNLRRLLCKATRPLCGVVHHVAHVESLISPSQEVLTTCKPQPRCLPGASYT